MNARKFFVVSTILAALACGLDILALLEFQHGMKCRAKAAQTSGVVRTSLIAEARHYSDRGNVALYSGLAVAVASVVTVIVSVQKREPARRIIPVVLLVFYVLLQFVLV